MNHFLLFILLFSSGIWAQTDIPYGNNPTTGKHIRINDLDLYYETYGTGEPLLLIHGNKTGIKGWKLQIESFKKHYNVIAVDCQGRGKSSLGNDTLSYLKMAHDLSKFIEVLAIDSVNILGKSDGGIVSLLMAIHHPERIKKIVAFGANTQPDTTALFQEIVEEIHDERIHAEEMIAKGDTTDNWKIVLLRNRMMEFQPNISFSELNTIACPVLVMSCDRDVIKEEHTFEIYKSIPNANLSIFPGEVHGVTRKNPELFNRTVLTFLQRPFADESIRF